MKFALTLLLIISLGGCSTIGSPQTAQQKVFAAGTIYTAAANSALLYINLPRCAAPAVQPCSEQAVVDQIKRADNVAFAALGQAKAVVVDPTKTATTANAAVTAVQSALTVFTSVLAQYKIGE